MIIVEYETIEFNQKLNAYLIEKPILSSTVGKKISDLIFPHPLSTFKISRDIYVPLINHEHVEFLWFHFVPLIMKIYENNSFLSTKNYYNIEY